MSPNLFLIVSGMTMLSMLALYFAVSPGTSRRRADDDLRTAGIYGYRVD